MWYLLSSYSKQVNIKNKIPWRYRLIYLKCILQFLCHRGLFVYFGQILILLSCYLKATLSNKMILDTLFYHIIVRGKVKSNFLFFKSGNLLKKCSYFPLRNMIGDGWGCEMQFYYFLLQTVLFFWSSKIIPTSSSCLLILSANAKFLSSLAFRRV